MKAKTLFAAAFLSLAATFLLALFALLHAGVFMPTAGSVPDAAQVRIEIRDGMTGRRIPARAYLQDAAGSFITPPAAIVYDKREEHHFIAPGEFSVALKPGRYTLRCERGPEYVPAMTVFEVGPEQRNHVVSLHRWIDMNRLGWFSGDLHNHRKPEEMPSLLPAEDLNLAPTLADWIWEDRSVSQPPRTSDPIREVDSSHAYSVLDKEVERLENGPGAVDLLGLRSSIPFDGYRLYPPDDIYCRQAHAQNGYVDAEKIVWRDAAALVALGEIDFAGIVHNHFNRHGVELETDRWGMVPKHRPEFNTPQGMPLWSMDVYYRLLNCGFHLPVSGGSASGVKASPLGYNRVYVRLAGPFNYRSWFESLKAGRSFATNGPMLFFTVNNKPPGSTLVFKGGKTRLVRIKAAAMSAGTLNRLEIIRNGQVIKTVTLSKATRTAADPSRPWSTPCRLQTELEARVDGSGWLAARCFEEPDHTIRFAHTSPVYVDFDSPPAIPDEDVSFFIRWMDREIEFYRREKQFREPQHQAEMIAFFERARAVFARLQKRRGARLDRHDAARPIAAAEQHRW